MSSQINPGSVSLNSLNYPQQYFAEYLPVPKEEQPPSCALPPGTELDLTPTSLLPLIESCAFQFPEVVPLPPVYNPPSIPNLPNLQFQACETLTAQATVYTAHAAKNSSLQLVAGGPKVNTPGGTADCTLNLTGLIDVVACETFDAQVNVGFLRAAKPSKLNIASTKTPNCGFSLSGVIDVAACEEFKATSSVTFLRAAKPSLLKLTYTNIPNCSIDIGGLIDVDACEKFEGKLDFNVSGPAVKKSQFSIQNTSTPNCGFTAIGEVQIEACTDFTTTGALNITGTAVKSNTLTVAANSQPNCGLVFSGGVVIDACREFTANSTLSFGGNAVKNQYIGITTKSAPNCGLTLTGSVQIDACDKVEIDTSGIKFSGLYGTSVNGSITGTSAAAPNCKIGLSGNVIVDACGSVQIQTDIQGGTIYLNNSKGAPSQKEIIRPTISQMVGVDKCTPLLKFSFPDISFEAIKSLSTNKDSKIGVMDGCIWEVEHDGLYLEFDEAFGDLTLNGQIPKPCFRCENQGSSCEVNNMELSYLSVDTIQPSSCCTDESVMTLDLCGGLINISDGYTATTKISSRAYLLDNNDGEYCHISPGSISLAGGDPQGGGTGQVNLSVFGLTITSNTGDSATLTGKMLSIAPDTGGSATFDSSSVTGTDDQGNSYTLSGESLSLAPADGGTVYITSTSLDIVSESSDTINITGQHLSLSTADNSVYISGSNIHLTNENGAMDITGNVSISTGGGSFTISEVESQMDLRLRQVEFCEGGVSKTAWVLMTAPR